jgi:heat shock protein HtpX
LNLGGLLAFSLVVGFTGSIFSLLISKPMAKWSTGAQVIEQPANSTELWLVDTVRRLATQAGIGMPEVAVYEGEPNAFATGANRNDALVAVSTGLLQNMTREEVEAVLGHEVAHIANGDMVTMTLLQGVVNTFVVFLSRVVGYLVDRWLSRDGEQSTGIGYMVTVIICQIVFGLLASIIVAWFSRQREFRADAGSAQLLGSKRPMINALARLGQMHEASLPQSVAALGINKSAGVMEWFASHPPIEERIAALQQS